MLHISYMEFQILWLSNENILVMMAQVKWFIFHFKQARPNVLSPFFSTKRSHNNNNFFFFFFFFFFLQRRHLLDNLDDKPADETERALVKNKISFPYYFFILTHPTSQSCFWSTAQTSQRTVSLLKCLIHAQCHRSRLTSLVI